MKKILLILLSLCFLFTQAYAFNPLVVCPGAVASGGSCDTVVWENGAAVTGDLDIHDNTFLAYIGQVIQDTTTKTICKVVFVVTHKTGDISGKTFRAYIVPLDYNDDFDVGDLTEADATVTGSNSWSLSSVSFEWSAGYTFTANENYGVMIYMDGAADASNYAEFEGTSTDNIPGGSASYWNETGGEGGPAAADGKVTLYE